MTERLLPHGQHRLSAWGVQERQVTANKPTTKGRRFPIQWEETVYRVGWYPNGLTEVFVLPKMSIVEPTEDAMPTHESVTVERIIIPAWIKRTTRFIESWIIATAESEPVRCGVRGSYGW